MTESTVDVLPPVADPDPAWQGEFRFTPFSVGDPGRAANVAAYPDPENWDYRDTVLDGVVLRGADSGPHIDLRAASVRGRAHRFDAKVRQDSYAFRCDGRFVVAAVADGVSSGPLSHVAANVVSQHGSHLLARQLQETPPEELDWGKLLRVLSNKVLNAGRRRLPGVEEPREIAGQLSTTALFAIVHMRPEDGCHRVYTFAYGDSSAWILRSGERWEPQRPVKNDGAIVASSATDALPFVPEMPPATVETRLGPADMLLLISDGIGDPLGNGTGPVGAFLADRWRKPPMPLEFAAHVDFARRSHDDDRTAVAIWPNSRA